ncbi:unnamed protein product [Dibothriocephalus latus]|uniref:Uncharacterized protein n=1 Tax=Dibothriocephalus latus TaxID=60516 RepID=A0A3P7NWX2_DIBLA|nr:unnamed protein product [Dibothriocephalus latus]
MVRSQILIALTLWLLCCQFFASGQEQNPCNGPDCTPERPEESGEPQCPLATLLHAQAPEWMWNLPPSPVKSCPAGSESEDLDDLLNRILP